MDQPLNKRPGYEEVSGHPLAKDLSDLARRHGLVGTVLISFKADEVGVDTTGISQEFGAAMERLGLQILTAIDDGDFEPEKT